MRDSLRCLLYDFANDDEHLPLQVGTAGFLLEAGCAVNVQGAHGMTALNEAALSNHPELLRTLLRYNADPAIPDDAGTLPLWFAVDNESRSAILLLLAALKGGAGGALHSQSTLNPATAPTNPLELAALKKQGFIVDWILAVCGEAAANSLRKYLPTLENSTNHSSDDVAALQDLVCAPQSLLRQSRQAVRAMASQEQVTHGLQRTEADIITSLPQMLKSYVSLRDLDADFDFAQPQSPISATD